RGPGSAAARNQAPSSAASNAPCSRRLGRTGMPRDGEVPRPSPRPGVRETWPPARAGRAWPRVLSGHSSARSGAVSSLVTFAAATFLEWIAQHDRFDQCRKPIVSLFRRGGDRLDGATIIVLEAPPQC